MLQGVVLNGTGKAAQLTSPIGPARPERAPTIATLGSLASPAICRRRLVGNDDFTPMARVTGGSFPAQTWHSFLVRRTIPTTFPRSPASRRTPFKWPSKTARRDPEGRGHERGDRHGDHHCGPDGGKRQGFVEHDAAGSGEPQHEAQRGARASTKRHHAAEPRRGAGGHAHPNRKRQPAERRLGAARRELRRKPRPARRQQRR